VQRIGNESQPKPNVFGCPWRVLRLTIRPPPLTTSSLSLSVSLLSVKVMDAQSLQIVQDFAIKDVLEIDFSPKGTFLSTWQRQSKDCLCRRLIFFFWTIVPVSDLYSPLHL